MRLKTILATSLLIMANSAFANSFNNALDASMNELRVSYNQNQVRSFRITKESNDFMVEFLTSDKQVNPYHCHLHGSDYACHEEDPKSTNATSAGIFFSKLKKGYQAAHSRLEAVLKRRKIKYSIEGIKTWAKSSDGHGHGSATQDVLTRIKYIGNGEAKEVLYLCHSHAPSEPLECHSSRPDEKEPKY